MTVRIGRFAAVVVAVLLCGVTAHPSRAVAAPAPGMDLYADPVNGWSISYPAGWRVDGADPAFVQIHDPENQALVAVRVAPTELLLNAVTNQLLASQAQYLQDKGLTWAQTSRQLITYPNGTPAVDVRGDMVPGGRTHQIYLEKNGKAFVVSAQSNIALWDAFSEDFDRTLLSFVLPP